MSGAGPSEPESEPDAFERYRAAKRYYGGRLDEKATLQGWVLNLALLVLTSPIWWFSIQGYSRMDPAQIGRLELFSPVLRIERTRFLKPPAKPFQGPGLLLRKRRPDELGVVFLDVGQGDAILLRTPSGTNVLLDTGRGADPNSRYSGRIDSFGRLILPLFRRNRIRELDVLITSHPQSDHIGSAAEILRSMPVEQLWIAGADNPITPRLRMLRAARETGTRIRSPGKASRSLRAGDSVPLGAATRAWVLRTDTDAREVNNASLSLLVSYGEVEILLPGDTEKSGERELVERWGPRLDVEVLKVAHHGSNTSSTRPFLEFVRPLHSVIMVGRRNRFGHPTEEVLGRLRATGTTVWRTDRDGSVYLFTDGKDIRVETRYRISAVK